MTDAAISYYRYDYPDVPGSHGVDTSIAAATDMAPVAGTLRHMVLTAVKAAGSRGLTTNEIADTLNIDRNSLQPRTTELKLLGQIEDSGQRRANANGKRAIVWTATKGGDE